MEIRQLISKTPPSLPQVPEQHDLFQKPPKDEKNYMERLLENEIAVAPVSGAGNFEFGWGTSRSTQAGKRRRLRSERPGRQGCAVARLRPRTGRWSRG